MKSMVMDHIDVANKKTVASFTQDYMPPGDQWKSWIHPTTKTLYEVTICTAAGLSEVEFEACFHLIEHTSSGDYKKSKVGWKPRKKRAEMKLLDLKYVLVKLGGQIEGFLSFMPTYEDEEPVVYCYEIHLSPALQGTGLGTVLMQHLEFIGSGIPDTAKAMLTCFVRNSRGVSFYQKLGYEKDAYSPPPKVLRDGTRVESDYIILSKAIPR